jgi:hypothetical protein
MNDTKFIFESSIGEIEIWAKDECEAKQALRHHGFYKVDDKKIKKAVVNVEHEEVR